MEGHAKFIKVTQKKKATQTAKPVEEPRPQGHQYGPKAIAKSCQYYMDKEKEVYQDACKINGKTMDKDEAMPPEAKAEAVAVGPTGGDDINKEEKEPSKIKYRYTLEEMKSYNPYRRSD